MKLEFVDNEITAYGGLALLKKMIGKTGFVQVFENLPLPVQGSNRSVIYSVYDICLVWGQSLRAFGCYPF
jgi:hypothetical protein